MDSVKKVVDYVQSSSIVTTLASYATSPSTSNDSNLDEGTPNDTMSSSTSTDNYLLTLPEEFLHMTRVSELRNAVDQCKALILERPDDCDDKKCLIRRLIELRLRLHNVLEAQLEENSTEDLPNDPIVVLGHHFSRQCHPKSITTNYCDRCSGVIWNAIHSWHLCADCDYKCHTWCLSQVCRVCAHVVVSENPSYTLEVCPEAAEGLAAQNYRCVECLSQMSFGETILQPRRCDYNGQYYCPTCHWNSTSVIPARVIHNWDFTERRVCRSSKQILSLLAQRPNLMLEDLNPALFAFVDELSTLKGIRQRLLQMKKYLTSCKIAKDTNILWQLRNRLHFLEGIERYSVQDLVDLRTGILIPDLHKLMATFAKHITEDCKICRAQGYICELCDDKSVIFPFGVDVDSCTACGTTYHVFCWIGEQRKCRKCQRRKSRQAVES